MVRCFVKGAPDVLAGRADRYLGGRTILPVRRGRPAALRAGNAELAEQGMRVLAVGGAGLPGRGVAAADDPKDLLDRIVLSRSSASSTRPARRPAKAIAQCRDAGIRVRMITGDHAVTAGAIAAELGIPGAAVTGAELDRITDDDELARRLDDIGVVARVSPEHKIRIVRALQARGDVVAMTGDGVNDAPALRKADIGVAMGVTGTEVTKEAATMVLTDDNFATIVGAVREGRGIYDNIVKFVRFQLSTALGFVLTFLVASLTGIAGGAPFTALQILFVNLVMDGPPAMSLGVDPVSPDAMSRPPRPAGERILTRPRLLRILLASAVMAAGTLAVLVWRPGPGARLGVPTVAGTMAFVTFVFFQVFNLLNVRHDTPQRVQPGDPGEPLGVRRHRRPSSCCSSSSSRWTSCTASSPPPTSPPASGWPASPIGSTVLWVGRARQDRASRPGAARCATMNSSASSVGSSSCDMASLCCGGDRRALPWSRIGP